MIAGALMICCLGMAAAQVPQAGGLCHWTPAPLGQVWPEGSSYEKVTREVILGIPRPALPRPPGEKYLRTTPFGDLVEEPGKAALRPGKTEGERP